ncbi:MAG: replication initiator protein A, partial [Dorea sp.]|nr:replication initiator protein A [Dorea sp.]
MSYFDYFHCGESERYTFFRMPRILFTDPKFNGISTDSKLLYGLLLDRMELSRRNGWVDEKDRVYIIFKVEEMAEILNRSVSRVYKMLSELDTSEAGIGLIERRRQGQGHPNLIYVKKFYEEYFRPLQNGDQDLHEKEVKTSTEKRSRPPHKRGQDLHEKQPHNTNNNKTDRNKTDVSIYSDSASLYGAFHNVHLLKQE